MPSLGKGARPDALPFRSPKAEKFDNAVRKMFSVSSVSKEELLKREAKWKQGASTEEVNEENMNKLFYWRQSRSGKPETRGRSEWREELQDAAKRRKPQGTLRQDRR